MAKIKHTRNENGPNFPPPQNKTTVFWRKKAKINLHQNFPIYGIQHLEQLRSHPRGIIHFRYYDVTSCDVTFGHVTSDSHATFGHEQWYILYYYCIKKKSRGIHFRGCAEDTSGNDVTSGHMTSCDLIPVRAASGDVTSSNACVMARSPLLPLNYALCYPDILL